MLVQNDNLTLGMVQPIVFNPFPNHIDLPFNTFIEFLISRWSILNVDLSRVAVSTTLSILLSFESISLDFHKASG